MKKITKYLVFSFLMVASLVATASFTYAYTSDGFSFDENVQKEIHVEWRGTTGVGERDVYDDGGALQFNIKDYENYDISYTYTMHVKIDNGDFVAYEGRESMDLMTYEMYIWEKTPYSEIAVDLPQGQEWVIYVYFTYTEPDASPVLDGQTAFVTTIDDPITVAEITSYISAYDETDGSLTHAIELVDSPRDFLIYTVTGFSQIDDNLNYDMSQLLNDYDSGTLDETIAGQPFTNTFIDTMYAQMYLVESYNDNVTSLEPDSPENSDSYVLAYFVKDSAGNYSALTVHVYVKDVLAPDTTDKTASVSYADTFNLSNYLSTQAKDMFADNYDSDEDLTIVIQNDDYTANKTIVGDHVVQFKATDTSGNVSYAELTISVYDDVIPTFSGPASITKATTETLTLSEIKAMLSANDVIDGSLTSSIQVVTDDFTGRGNLVGSYDIQFSVTDAAGNIAYHTVTINVVDDIPPVFYVKDGYFISVSSAVDLTISDVIDILEITGQITVDGTGGITVTTLLDEYTGNENTAGIYAMSFNVTAVNGEESVYSVAIEVLNDEDDGGLVIDEDEDQLQPLYDAWDATKDWVKNNVLWTVAIGIGLVVLIGVIIGFASSKPYKHRCY